MEDNNESKSYLAIFFTIFATVGVVLLLIFGGLAFTYYEKYINIAYINIPGKESCIKELKDYHVYNNGGMITLIFADGTKITTSTKNVVLVKGRKIMKGNIYSSKSIEEENKNIKSKDTDLDLGDLDDEVKTDERPDERSVGDFDGEDLDEE